MNRLSAALALILLTACHDHVVQRPPELVTTAADGTKLWCYIDHSSPMGSTVVYFSAAGTSSHVGVLSAEAGESRTVVNRRNP